MSDNLLPAAHFHPVNVITEALGVNPETGLSENEAVQRLALDGPNTLVRVHGKPWWKILGAQFSSIVIWLLAVAAVIAWFTQNQLEAAAIMVVLGLNALIGFAIERKAGQALEALRREIKNNARVRRDCAEKIIDAAELVAGDIIVLAAGDRVPADSRLLEVVNLKTNESTFTGESVPVDKAVDSVDLASLLAERTSMVYLATTIVAGRALAVVTATGERTELGRIEHLLAKTEEEQTPLERRLQDLGRRLVYVVLGIAAVVLVAGLIRGDELWLMLEVSISLAVAAVPEGLPTVTTLILALGVLRMARRKAIVRRLAAVETLGSTTVICADKTGTLTENRMTVQEYFLANGQRIKIDETTRIDEDFAHLLRASVLCNDASIDARGAENRAIGDPTETALLVAADKLGLDIAAERAACKKLAERPFEAATRRMISVFAGESDERFCVMKGAPNVVVDACTHFAAGGINTSPLDKAANHRFLNVNEAMAARGLRVLAFAYKPFKGDDSISAAHMDIEDKYIFLGLAGMSDPPRTGVAHALNEAHSAGIRTVMLTGDQISTARAIAAELELNGRAAISAFNASDIHKVSSAELATLAREADVFARVSPEEKLYIVEALKDAGEIVAVTGDGINDAPALKKADIGIAMGERGTEVAKEAADVVLTDDNFATIVEAIRSGRTIYANIIKFVHLLFSDNLSEVLLIFSTILIGLPLPMLPLQILWVNLVTDVFPALALALEPSSPDAMKRRPRPPNETLLSARFMFLIFWKGVVYSAIALAAYVWALQRYGEGPHSRTIALLAIIAVQVGNLFNCRSRTKSAFVGFFRNPFVFASVGIVVVLQLVAIYFPPISAVLDVTKPLAEDWLIIFFCTILPIGVVEISKLAVRSVQLRSLLM